MKEHEQVLHNEKLYDLCPSPNIIMETDTTMRHGWRHERYTQEPQKNNQHGRYRHRWKDNIKTDLNMAQLTNSSGLVTTGN